MGYVDIARLYDSPLIDNENDYTVQIVEQLDTSNGDERPMKKKALIQLGIFAFVLSIVLTTVIKLETGQHSAKQKIAGIDITRVASKVIHVPPLRTSHISF